MTTASGHRKYGLLGFAFLLQFVTSLAAGVLQKSCLVFPDNIEKTLRAVAERELLFRGTLFLDGATALGVVFLGVVLYQILKSCGRYAALTGLGFYIMEAVIHITGKIQAISLAEMGRTLIQEGESAHLFSVARQALDTMAFSEEMMMFAFCPGAVLFYTLIVKAKIVPRPLALWGLITVGLLGLWTALSFFKIDLPFFLYFPYVPFELIIGVWLLIKGSLFS